MTIIQSSENVRWIPPILLIKQRQGINCLTKVMFYFSCRKFVAVFDQNEINDLLEKASDYESENQEGEGHAFCRWFYRNQSPDYFEDIQKNGGIMETVLKDYTGDPRSPINGTIRGLFFSATVKCNNKYGDPIPFSPFGPRRLLVPALHLLAKAPKIYFADFYCMPCSDNHYVTIVMTTPGSETDKFCAEHLVKLDIWYNPFLFKDEFGSLQVTTKKKLYVEMYYTEDLDIKPYLKKGFLEDCETVGQGHSTPGGISKTKSCTICNL